MNSSLTAFQAAYPANGTGGVSSMSLDADHLEELFSIWKSVFNRTHAATARHEPAEAQAPDRAVIAARLQHGGDAHEGQAADEAPVTTADDAPTWQHTVRSNVEARIDSAEAGEAPSALAGEQLPASLQIRVRESSVDGVAAKFDQAPPMLSPLPSTKREELDIGSAPPAEQSQTQTTDGEQSASADSVSVFVQGNSVAIVVRDAAISEQEAVRCAFATAHELTGQRTALTHLTLNGRTLYQQMSTSNAAERSAPALVFAC